MGFLPEVELLYAVLVEYVYNWCISTHLWCSVVIWFFCATLNDPFRTILYCGVSPWFITITNI
jgi:hypothetical protein